MLKHTENEFDYWKEIFDFFLLIKCKVRTDSSTEFGSDPILIDRIRIESAAGSNPILIVQIRTAVDRAADFNERVTAFTTGRARSDVKGGYCLVPGPHLLVIFISPYNGSKRRRSRDVKLVFPVTDHCHGLLIDHRSSPLSTPSDRLEERRRPRMIDSWWRHDLPRAAEHRRWSRAARLFWVCVAKLHVANAIDNPRIHETTPSHLNRSMCAGNDPSLRLLYTSLELIRSIMCCLWSLIKAFRLVWRFDRLMRVYNRAVWRS